MNIIDKKNSYYKEGYKIFKGDIYDSPLNFSSGIWD